MKQSKILTNSEIAAFCSQMSLILGAGIAPVEGLAVMLSDTPDENGREIINSILTVCMKGESFHAACKASGVFPLYVLNMITIGEESGNLDDVMQSLSNYYEREENISESIRNAVSYPIIMIAMMLLVIIVLMTKVLPIFNQVFIQLGSEMTGISKTLMSLGNTMNRYSIGIIVFLIVCIAIFLFATKTNTGKHLYRSLFSKFALTRGFYDDIASGRFASGMALTLSSGLDTYQSLDMVSDLVDNEKMNEKILNCKRFIESGSNFAEALGQAAIFSNLYSRMISVGFRTGSVDMVMAKIAVSYEKKTDEKIFSIISILEPTLVIILSMIVGLILLSVIMPLMGIMASIG